MLEAPKEQKRVKGGILADEMGLGKVKGEEKGTFFFFLCFFFSFFFFVFGFVVRFPFVFLSLSLFFFLVLGCFRVLFGFSFPCFLSLSSVGMIRTIFS